jgi:ligand-binding sensor domain-containing protein
MRPLLFLFAFGLSHCLLAQSPTIKFNHLTMDDGLVSNDIKSIFADSEGFVWVGTRNGLSRYDGKNFKNYKHNPDDSTSISNGYIWHIHETQDGLLWFGTKNGLTVLNKKTDRFKTYYHQKNNPNSLADSDVREILEDEHGTIWLGTKNGLTAFDRQKNIFKNYPTPNPYNAGNPNPIWAMCLDRKKRLWLGTAQGLFIFDREKGEFFLQPYQFRQKDNAFIEVFEDKEGYLWVSSNGGGTYLIPPDEKQEQTRIFARDLANNQGFTGKATNKIRQDKHGLIWFLHTEEGISVYSHQTKRFTNYEKDASNPFSLSNNATVGFCEDKNGNIWIGTYQSGLNYFDNRQQGKSSFQLFQHSPFAPEKLPDQAIAAIFEDSEGLLWIGTYGKGISVYNPQNQTYTTYNYKNTQGALCSDLVALFEEDSKGNILVGTSHCTCYFDKKTKKFLSSIGTSNPSIEENLFDGTLSAMYKNRAGIFYFGGNMGFYRLINNELKQWSKAIDQNGKEHKLDKIAPIVADKLGLLWIGKSVVSKGFFSFDPQTEKFTHHLLEPDKPNALADDNIYDLALDSKNTLWVATSEGLFFKEKQKNQFANISEKVGLPSNMVYSIVTDKKDNLWLATSAGICKLTPELLLKKKEGAIKKYDFQDGAVGSDQSHTRYAKFTDKNGYIYFGGSKGFCKFHPDSIQENTLAPKVVFTSFKLFEQEYQLDTAITYKKHITLAHHQNFLSFEFAALNFIRPNKNQYAYRIEGLNKNWIPLGNKNSVSIAGLEPDTYTLRVKASNNDGVWNEKGATLTITILPPWWETWWFISLVIIAIGGISYWFYRDRIDKIRKEEAYKRQVQEMEMRNKQMQEYFQEKETQLELIAANAKIETHFFANCISAIDTLKMKNQVEEANLYSEKFNKLMRLALDIADKKRIPLAKELDFLALYVSLQQLRFRDKFDFRLQINEEVDTTYLQIPPMLIQPYIENAILHGLRPKKEKGNLTLKITEIEDGLTIEVEDDGMGIHESKKQKSVNGSTHISKGMEITQVRLEKLAQLNKISLSETTEELKDEQGKANGTRVKITVAY